MKEKTMKEKTAKFIRIITAPPILAFLMMSILFCKFGAEFASASEFAIAALFLSLIPISAYPLAHLRKETVEKLREDQRKLAFILSFCGYLLAFIIGKRMECTEMLMCVLFSYFVAVVMLTILNKFFRFRASGHACSCTLPYLFLIYWLGSVAALICIVLYGVEFWASIELKRHTVKEFVIGSIVAFVAFGIAALHFGFY